MAIFSKFVGLTDFVKEITMDWLQEAMLVTEEPKSISRLFFYSQIRGAYLEKQRSSTPVERHRLNQAYSDALDNFYQSDDSSFRDDFLVHATESDHRPPISTPG
ncbi:unnamed protein product [Cuscuta epithymum]|uniref:Uncharacterized protein n=1 Tax=Cuscuta epithymum TaxID=186058 RepID=A0AAV0CBW7_9ASTE|nr:unnamed protein product [Cuscuta epithymum]